MNKKIFSICFFLLSAVYVNLDAAEPGGITGYITVANFQEPAAGFIVEAVDGSEQVIESTITDSDGKYVLDGIIDTYVYIRVPEQFGYEKRFYADASIVSNAVSIYLVPQGVVDNINIVLDELLTAPDNDADGIRDAEEVIYGADGYRTDPINPDTDGDLLDDGEETSAGIDSFFTDPTLEDTDGDSILDGADLLPVQTYINIYVVRGALAAESTTVVAEIRDLYHNLVTKNGIRFSVSCSGSATFATSANVGTIVSGGGSSSVEVQTTGGMISIDLFCPVVEDVAVTAIDSDALGILTFSEAMPFHAGTFSLPQTSRPLTDSPVQFVDDFERDVPLGIAFDFFGQTYTRADLHSNGFITFDLFEGIPTESFYQQMYTNDPIPNASIPNNYIAPYWDDLDIEAHGTGKMSYATQHNAAGTMFRVRWKDHGIYDSREPMNALLTFHAVLFEHSNLIMFYYEELIDGTVHDANGSSATVGAENSDGSAGIEFSYSSASLSEGLAIIMSTAGDTIAHFLPAAGDYDGDGLSNGDERTLSFTDPVNPDTDGDGLPDKWEYDYYLNPNSATGLHGAEGDYDNDGVSNIGEYSNLILPNDNDSDDDGLSDGDELFVYHTFPDNFDTDADTLSDGEEINYGVDGFRTNPLLQDSDADGSDDNVDPIPVYARLVIVEPPDTFIGNPSPAPVKFQLWSMEGDLLTAVDSLVFDATVTGSAFFVDPAVKGTILSGAGTNTVRVQLDNGEAHLMVWDLSAAEEVSFAAADPFASGVRFPMASAGYQAVPYGFIDIAAPENLIPLIGDDVSVNSALPSGFFFRYFGDLYSWINTLKISSNGYVTFSSYATAVNNQNIPFHGANDPDAYIAPFWDDLLIYSDSIYVKVLGAKPSRRFVVQWNEIALAINPNIKVTFQIVIYELDSLIEFHYALLGSTGRSATIGMENADGTAGVLIGYNAGVIASNSGYALFDGYAPSMQFINGDFDGDGLYDLDEIALGIDPALRDTDGDGLEDNDELTMHNTDPADDDSDNDGLNDMREIFDYDTDPNDSDSDDDMFSDSEEVIAGTDPNDDTSYLHVVSFMSDPQTLGFTITWSSVAGKTYQVWAMGGLLGAEFVMIGDIVASDELTSFVDQGDEQNDIAHPLFESERLYKVIIE